jgi:hypothetical protein
VIAHTWTLQCYFVLDSPTSHCGGPNSNAG